MRLAGKDLQAFLKGCVSVTQNPNGSISPVRFTGRQLAFYARTESDRIRSYASAGVSILLETDADLLSFKYSVLPGSSQDIYGFDLYVNGALSAHTDGSIGKSGEECIAYPLPEGNKRIRLYLPNLAVTRIWDFELENAGYARACELPKALFLGDSIIQGYTTRFPSRTLVNLLNERLSLDILNQGMAGAVFESETLDEITGFCPERVFIAFGTNDWNLRQKAELEREAGIYLDKVRTLWRDIPVTVISPIWRADEADAKCFPFSETDEVIESIAQRYTDVRFISGYDLVPHDPALYADGLVHPNEEGFTKYADSLLSLL